MATVVPTTDVLFTTPYTDPDVSAYGETPSASELEIRAAATPAGSGALVIRRQSVNQILQSLAACGYLEIRGRTIVIKELDQLRRRAGV